MACILVCSVLNLLRIHGNSIMWSLKLSPKALSAYHYSPWRFGKERYHKMPTGLRKTQIAIMNVKFINLSGELMRPVTLMVKVRRQRSSLLRQRWNCTECHFLHSIWNLHRIYWESGCYRPIKFKLNICSINPPTNICYINPCKLALAPWGIGCYNFFRWVDGPSLFLQDEIECWSRHVTSHDTITSLIFDPPSWISLYILTILDNSTEYKF